MTESLNRSSPQALYRQLIAALLERISTGQLGPGDELPSVRELTDLYQVSNITVRRALGALQQQGYVYSVPGRGTFVADSRVSKHLGPEGSFTLDMRRAGLEPSSTVLRAEIVPAQGRIAEALALSPGSDVVLLERIRLGSGVRLVVQASHLPHALCPGILRHDFSRTSLYQVLREEYGLTLSRSSPRIRASLASERELRLLQMSPPACVLWVEGRIYLPSGQPIEYAASAYRADRFEISLPHMGSVTTLPTLKPST